MAGWWPPGPRPLTQRLPSCWAAPTGTRTPRSARGPLTSPTSKIDPERKLARDPLCHWAGPSRASGCAQATTQHYVPHPELASWGSPDDHRPSKPRCPQNRCHVTAGDQEQLEYYGLNCCGQPWAGVPREGTQLLAHSQCPQKRDLSIPPWEPLQRPIPSTQSSPTSLSSTWGTEEDEQKKAKKGQKPTVWGSGPLLKAPLQKDGLGKKNQSCT